MRHPSFHSAKADGVTALHSAENLNITLLFYIHCGSKPRSLQAELKRRLWRLSLKLSWAVTPDPPDHFVGQRRLSSSDQFWIRIISVIGVAICPEFYPPVVGRQEGIDATFRAADKRIRNSFSVQE